MSNYIHVTIHVTDQFVKDLLVAHLFDKGFEGMEEQPEELNAFIKQDHFDEAEVKSLLDNYKLSYAVTIVASQNWNALWERNFEPVVIKDFCIIRADFHDKDETLPLDIIITPKMSFGTGHHATTYMMVEQMSYLLFENKKVADFGTGTGILAIVAEKLGASRVRAIDVDDLSIENAVENIERNKCFKIEVIQADLFSSVEKFDIILANINKNVIIDNIQALATALNAGGKVLLSGLLKEDEPDILMACQAYNLRRLNTLERNKWISILLEHNI